jgi:hypothetical protein
MWDNLGLELRWLWSGCSSIILLRWRPVPFLLTGEALASGESGIAGLDLTVKAALPLFNRTACDAEVSGWVSALPSAGQGCVAPAFLVH